MSRRTTAVGSKMFNKLRIK